MNQRNQLTIHLIVKDLSEDDFKTTNDTIPLKRAVMPNTKVLEVKETGGPDETGSTGDTKSAKSAESDKTSPPRGVVQVWVQPQEAMEGMDTIMEIMGVMDLHLTIKMK